MRRWVWHSFVIGLPIVLTLGCKPSPRHVETVCGTDLLFRVVDDGKSKLPDFLKNAKLLVADDADMMGIVSYIRFVSDTRAVISWPYVDFIYDLKMEVSPEDGGVRFLKGDDQMIATLRRPGGLRAVFFTTRCVKREGPLCVSESGPQLFLVEMSCADEQVVSK